MLKVLNISIVDFNQLEPTYLYVFCIGVIIALIIGIMYLLRKMGDDERSDLVFYKVGSLSFLIYVGLNHIFCD